MGIVASRISLCKRFAVTMVTKWLDTEAAAEAMLRLASFEPRMTAAIPKGDICIGLHASRRAGI